MARGNGKCHTPLVVGSARLLGGTYVARTIPGPVRHLRVAGTAFNEEDDDDLSFAVIGKANPDGTLFNPYDGAGPGPKRSTGRLYLGMAAMPGIHGSRNDSQKNVI